MSVEYWISKYRSVVSLIEKNSEFDIETPSIYQSFEVFLLRTCKFIYKQLGSCLPEKVYQQVLFKELIQRYSMKFKFTMEEVIPIYYENIEVTYRRMDITIRNMNGDLFAVLELKSANKVEFSQISNYLHMTSCRVGYLINFEKVSEHPNKDINLLSIQTLGLDGDEDVTINCKKKKEGSLHIYKCSLKSHQNEITN